MATDKTLIIDADAHVVESAHTWDYMDSGDKQFRPIPLETREEAGVKLQFWLIDGKVRGFRFPAFSADELEKRSQQVGRKFAEAQESRELGNVDLRLEHMNDTGVDVQVLHNTMFIESATDRAAVEVALCKSWNRWLADIWRQAKGRLRWSCMAPTLSMPDALDQIRFEIGQGETVGLVGPNGAGKTTLFLCLAGVLPVRAGQIRLLGLDPGIKADRQQMPARRKVRQPPSHHLPLKQVMTPMSSSQDSWAPAAAD